MRMKYMTVIIAVGCLSMADRASALPITYSFEGIGSGSLNNVSFLNTEIAFELTADTSDVYSEGGVFFNDVDSSYINIAGFSTASFTTPDLRMFMNSGYNALGFQDSIHADLLDIRDGALAGYNLATDIGVIYEPDPFAYTQMSNVSTSLGLMSLSNVDWVNFSATTVPEPASIGLLGLVSGGIYFSRRFFRI